MKIKIGCDPELFITDQEGHPRSAFGIIPGTKEHPHVVDKGAVQVDGMALEFNTDPAETEDEFVENVSTVMRQLRSMVDPKYKFAIVPSVRFNGNYLKHQPKEAKELGCMPDFSAYTLKENPRPNEATTLRTASGHIHIGFTEGADIKDPEHMMKCATLCKHLDLFLGLRSLEWDKDKKRRELYGAPGAMRIKPYGLEYRVLSNKWLESEALTRFVFKQTIACIEDLKTKGALTPHKVHYGSPIDPYSLVSKEINDGRVFFTKHSAVFAAGRNAEALRAANSLKIGG
jgi:hypothetical protein